MPLSPQPRHPTLTNGDQTVTKVDTRLTKVDKTDHCQPRSPSRHTPNNPEQIRTNPNTAERPDQIESLPDHPRTPRKNQP